MNPEFQRNLWLEIPPHRLVAQPAVLLLVFLAASLATGIGSFPSVAEVMLGLLLVVWGSRLAAESVIGEMIARTWDGQRMSDIGPWQMAWGKLLGATAYVWYGAFWCLVAFAIGAGRDGFGLARLLLGGLEAQILALMLGLILIQTEAPSHRMLISAAQAVAVAIVGPLLIALEYFSTGTVVWYGIAIDAGPFVVVTMFLFLLWSLLGLYEMMRAELQYPVRTVWWFLFSAFTVTFIAGFDDLRDIVKSLHLPGSAVDRLFLAYLTAVFLTYFCAFLEPKGLVRLRRWLKAWHNGHMVHAVGWAPVWFGGVALVLVLAFLTALNVIALGEASPARVAQLSLIAAMPLFLIRDMAVLYYLNFEGNPHRSHFGALTFLLFAYFIVPVGLSGAGLEGILPVLVPSPASPEIAVLPVVIQVVLAVSVMSQRWRGMAVDATDPQHTNPLGR